MLPAPEEPVVWSRKVERMVPQPDFAPLPPEELPPAWLRAIGQSESPASSPPAPAETPPVPEAPPVEEANRPTEREADDLDVGSGI